jgi:hypothetical protein
MTHNPTSQPIGDTTPMRTDQIPCIIDDAGFVDGVHWDVLEEVFERWTRRHRCRRAVNTAKRMAATVGDIALDPMMVASGIIEAEYDEQFHKDGVIRPEHTRVWQTFDAMCEQFTSGYQPKDATGFVKDLIARLAGLR